MMSPDLQRILRIRDYCLEIQKTISRYGNDFQIFDSDGDYQRSIAFSILQIGELGGSLSEAYRKETCNRIQWGPIKGMRNMVAHSYGSMSREIIWETTTMDIPVLLNFCEEQLKKIICFVSVSFFGVYYPKNGREAFLCVLLPLTKRKTSIWAGLWTMSGPMGTKLPLLPGISPCGFTACRK